MTRHWRRNSLRTAVALFLVAAGCRDSGEATKLGGMPPLHPIAHAPASEAVLEFVGSRGTAAGIHAFGMIGPVAVSQRGILAAFDYSSCRVFLWSLSESKALAPIGRCGDGPGEFRQVTAMTFVGDTLVTYASQTQWLQFVSDQGIEYRRLTLPKQFGPTAVIQNLAFIAPGVFAASIARVPGDLPAALGSRLLVTFTTDSARILASAVENSRIAMQNPATIMTGLEMCGWYDGSVAVLSQWSFEGGTFQGSSLRPRFHFDSPLNWEKPIERTAPPSHLPGAFASAVACGGFGAVFWKLSGDRSERPPKPNGGHIEFRRYDGATLLAFDFSASDSLFFERPIAAYSDRIFFRANRYLEFPRILEFRLRKRIAVDTVPFVINWPASQGGVVN